MEQKNVETKLTYDDRRKILVQERKEVNENKTEIEGKEVLMSTSTHKLVNEFTEDGIKLARKNLKKTLEYMKDRKEQLKHQFENEVEMTDELKKLEKDMKLIKQAESVQKAKQEYEKLSEDEKLMKKDLADIEKEIGSRIKFD